MPLLPSQSAPATDFINQESRPVAADPNAASRHDNQPPSSRYGGPSVAPKGGFEAYFNHRVNTGGPLWGRKGAPAAYSSGPYKGMSAGQAEEAARAEYAGMPDDQRQNWEKTAIGSDIRSPREMAAAGQPGAANIPQPPFTASGANPTVPPANATAGALSTPYDLGAVTDGNWGKSGNNPLANPPAASPSIAPTPAPGAPPATPPANFAPPVTPPLSMDRPMPGTPAFALGAANAPATPDRPQPAAGLEARPPGITPVPQTAPMAMDRPMPGAPMITSGGGTAPTDASGVKPTTPPYSAPTGTASTDEDIDPATGKKRVSATPPA